MDYGETVSLTGWGTFPGTGYETEWEVMGSWSRAVEQRLDSDVGKKLQS